MKLCEKSKDFLVKLVLENYDEEKLKYIDIPEEEKKYILDIYPKLKNNIKDMFDKLEIDDKFEKLYKKCIEIKLSDEKTTIFSSKMGGMPYLPLEFDYPKSKYTNEPLVMLIQINFEEMPALDYFPTYGILQIFIPYEHEFYGINLYNDVDEDDIKIIYHKNIIKDENLLYKDLSHIKFCDEYYKSPFTIKKMNGFLTKSYPNFSCELEFFEEIETSIKKYFEENEIPHITNDDIICFLRFDYVEFDRNQIGGYTYWINDPLDEALNKILLFQLTDYNYFDGVLNFFIDKQDLKRLDFSNTFNYFDAT